MRVELFAKDTTSLIATSRFLAGAGARGLNLPNKAKDAPPMPALAALSTALTPAQLREVVPHYSLKFNSERSPASPLAKFEAFLEEAKTSHDVRQCLLVSGSGTRAFDTVACLEAMRLPADRSPEIGVAFNPYLPAPESREAERARLLLKLQTGRVQAVWLQIGSDLALLAEGLAFVQEAAASLPSSQRAPLRVYGSVFLPSKRLLAQMRFRPWNGVFLSEEFLSGVPAAEAITREVLRSYASHGVEPLIETAINSEQEWAQAP